MLFFAQAEKNTQRPQRQAKSSAFLCHSPSCAFRLLFASAFPLKWNLSEQSKPMNFVPDGVHRMFQLTHRGPPEIAVHSPCVDMGCTVKFGYRNEQPGLCSPANGVAEQLQKNAEHSSWDTSGEWVPEFTS